MPDLTPRDEEEFVAFVLRYLDGATSPEEDARLGAQLKSPENAAYRELFVSLSRQRGQLQEILAGRTAQSPRRTHRWKMILGLAAGLLLGIVGLVFLTRDRAVQVALVEKVEGKVLRLDGEESGAVAPGERLTEGEGLETKNPGGATLRFEDGTRIALGPQSRVRGVGALGGKKLFLQHGSIRVDARKQPSDQPLVIRTAEGEAKVVGTRFSLVARSGSTRLDVETGTVRLTRKSDQKSAEVGAGQYAVASPKEDLVARNLVISGPAFVSSMAPNSWAAISGTALIKVAPDPAAFPAIQGHTGVGGVVDSWSGGALDSKRHRLLVWGGGHSNYYGNEVYAFDLESFTWQRLTEPSPQPKLNEDLNADGTPNARATYNGLAYIGHADRLFSFGGSIAGNGYASCKITWALDLESRKWVNRAPAGEIPPPEFGCTSAYDPKTGKVWWGETAGLYSYDYDANRWTKHNNDSFYYFTSALDTRRGWWVVVGNGKVFAYDVRGANLSRIAWTTTGGEELIKSSNPGLDYDPVRDRIVGWSGGAVYALDPETKAWTPYAPPGAPARTQNGIYGRWRYVPSLDAFVIVTSASLDVHVYRPGR